MTRNTPLLFLRSVAAEPSRRDRLDRRQFVFPWLAMGSSGRWASLLSLAVLSSCIAARPTAEIDADTDRLAFPALMDPSLSSLSVQEIMQDPHASFACDAFAWMCLGDTKPPGFFVGTVRSELKARPMLDLPTGRHRLLEWPAAQDPMSSSADRLLDISATHEAERLCSAQPPDSFSIMSVQESRPPRQPHVIRLVACGTWRTGFTTGFGFRNYVAVLSCSRNSDEAAWIYEIKEYKASPMNWLIGRSR